MLVHGEFGCRQASTQDLRRVHMGIAEREAAEGGLQLVERQPGVEERAERHVAGDAREAIEVQHTAHSCPASLKLQYRTSPSTT